MTEHTEAVSMSCDCEEEGTHVRSRTSRSGRRGGNRERHPRRAAGRAARAGPRSRLRGDRLQLSVVGGHCDAEQAGVLGRLFVRHHAHLLALRGHHVGRVPAVVAGAVPSQTAGLAQVRPPGAGQPVVCGVQQLVAAVQLGGLLSTDETPVHPGGDLHRGVLLPSKVRVGAGALAAGHGGGHDRHVRHRLQPQRTRHAVCTGERGGQRLLRGVGWIVAARAGRGPAAAAAVRGADGGRHDRATGAVHRRVGRAVRREPAGLPVHRRARAPAVVIGRGGALRQRVGVHGDRLHLVGDLLRGGHRQDGHHYSGRLFVFRAPAGMGELLRHPGGAGRRGQLLVSEATDGGAPRPGSCAPPPSTDPCWTTRAATQSETWRQEENERERRETPTLILKRRTRCRLPSSPVTPAGAHQRTHRRRAGAEEENGRLLGVCCVRAHRCRTHSPDGRGAADGKRERKGGDGEFGREHAAGDRRVGVYERQPPYSSYLLAGPQTVRIPERRHAGGGHHRVGRRSPRP
eukprot:ctg_2222.g539